MNRLCQVLLGNQTIATIFRDEKSGIGRITLDFLPQAIDMGFERMGRHPVIIAPDFLQQDVAGDGLGALTVEIFQDRRFLVRQPNLDAIAGLQNF